jgi:DNA invertase Pin-like site-specific DNA recombinase
MVRIMGAFAEWERDRICERHRDSKAMRKRLGLSIYPTPPYGFRNVKKRCEATGKLEWHLERDEGERALGAAIVQFREQGWAWQLIADHLTAHKIFFRNHRRWLWANVRDKSLAELALREAEAKKEGEQTA